MPALNFKKQFRPHIKSGRKKHTIRDKRKRPIKVGDKLYLYTGMRTKTCRKIMQTTCVKVEEIEIKIGGNPNNSFHPSVADQRAADAVVTIDGLELSKDEREALAYADGFDSFADMMKFWDGRLPFVGDIIYWKESSHR